MLYLLLVVISGEEFTIEKPVLAPGEATELRWDLPGAHSIFISHLGQVSPSGSLMLNPEASATYFVLYVDAEGQKFKSLDLRVQGTRGDLPAETDFRYPVQFSPPQTEISQVLIPVFEVLQDSFGFSTAESFSPREQRYLFVTRARDHERLVLEKQTGRSYRVALWVEVRPLEGGQMNCTVKSLVRYKRRLEPDLPKSWQDADEPYYRHAAGLVKDRLVELLAGH